MTAGAKLSKVQNSTTPQSNHIQSLISGELWTLTEGFCSLAHSGTGSEGRVHGIQVANHLCQRRSIDIRSIRSAQTFRSQPANHCGSIHLDTWVGSKWSYEERILCVTDGPTAPCNTSGLANQVAHETPQHEEQKPKETCQVQLQKCADVGSEREMPWTRPEVLTTDMPAAATANGEIPHLTGGGNVFGCYWTIASPKQEELDIWKPRGKGCS